MTRVLVAAMALAAAAPASAQTIDEAFAPTLRIDQRTSVMRVEGLEVTQRDGIVWVAMTLSQGAFHRRWGTSIIDLDAPAGTRMLGMAITDASSTRWSVAQPVLAAERLFRNGPSPALLSLHGSTAGVDHFELAIDDSRTPRMIAFALQLTGPAQLAIVGPPHVPITIDGAAGTAVVLAATEPITADVVDRGTSLVTMNGVADLVPDVSPPPRVMGALDKAIIRRVIRRHRDQLTRCYMAAAQWMPSLHGTVTLHFSIDGLGVVSDAWVDGEIQHPGVLDCLTAEAASWEFPSSGEGRVEINYPIEFRLRPGVSSAAVRDDEVPVPCARAGRAPSDRGCGRR